MAKFLQLLSKPLGPVPNISSNHRKPPFVRKVWKYRIQQGFHGKNKRCTKNTWNQKKQVQKLDGNGDFQPFLYVLPRNLTWNLKMMVSKRNHLFQGLLFRFHVKFQGCNDLESGSRHSFLEQYNYVVAGFGPNPSGKYANRQNWIILPGGKCFFFNETTT